MTVRLSSVGLTNVSTAIGALTALKELDVSHNDNLTSIPSELGSLLVSLRQERPLLSHSRAATRTCTRNGFFIPHFIPQHQHRRVTI